MTSAVEYLNKSISDTDTEASDRDMGYIDAIVDVVRAWDEIVERSDGRTEAFEEFAAIINELRPLL